MDAKTIVTIFQKNYEKNHNKKNFTYKNFEKINIKE